MMKCAKVNKLLSRLLDCQLDPALTAEIYRHLETCAHCRQEFELLQADQRLLQSLSVPEISPYFTTRTLARIRTLKPAPGLPKLLWQTAVTLLLLAGIGLGIFIGSGLAQNTATSPELAALNTEPSIEEIFTPTNRGR
jgi:anti-sigma factor RsiW